MTETRELIPPAGILPFALTQGEANQALRGWLEENSLRIGAKPPLSDGLYLPVWTFDVSGEVRWAGKKLEKRHGWTNGVTENGSYPIFYDNVLVPASHTLSADLAKEVNNFRLDALVPYDPGYLANWPAEIYQLSVSNASLSARRQAWEQARRQVATRVRIHHVKDLTVSSAGMVIESFKLILSPVWVAHYHYQGEDYKVAVNEQTGNKRGKRPQGGLRKWLDGIF